MPSNIYKYTNTTSITAYSKITASESSQHKETINLQKTIFTFLLNVHNIICLSCHERVCLMNLGLEDTSPTIGEMMGEVSLET